MTFWVVMPADLFYVFFDLDGEQCTGCQCRGKAVFRLFSESSTALRDDFWVVASHFLPSWQSAIYLND